MPKVNFKSADGTTHTVEAPAGRSIMLAATTNGVPGIDADCGGALACATCHVYVDPEWIALLPTPEEGEVDMLEATAAPRRATSRLSCQLVMTTALDEITVEIPDRQF